MRDGWERSSGSSSLVRVASGPGTKGTHVSGPPSRGLGAGSGSITARGAFLLWKRASNHVLDRHSSGSEAVDNVGTKKKSACRSEFAWAASSAAGTYPQQTPQSEPSRTPSPQGCPQRRARRHEREVLFDEGLLRTAAESASTAAKNARKLPKMRCGTRPGSGRRCGAEAQSRTGDTGLFRAVLYQLSYLGGDMRGRPDLNRRSLE